MLRYIFRGHDQPGFLAAGCALSGADALLHPCPGNRPPADGPYLCIVPLRDAWRADQALAQRRGERHFSADLEPAVLADLRAGRSLLVLDMSNEGPGFHAPLFASLHATCLRAGIPFARVVWLCQNRAMPAAYRAGFGLGSGETVIGFEHYDFFLKHTAWMFSPRAAAPVLGADAEAHVRRMYDPAAKDRLLLCLNATPRLHRVLALAGLIHRGLFDGALVSFAGLHLAKDPDVGSEARIQAYLAGHPELAHLAEACHRAAALRDLKVDDFAETGNALFNKIDVQPYLRTHLSLVTETDFTRGEVDRVSEKIVKPFCLGHPTLVVGNPGSLRFMTELGLHDFGDVLDHGYDREPHPPARLIRVLDEAARQAEAIRQDPGAWLGRVREAGSANIRLAASGRLFDAYVARHERPLFERLQRRLAAPP